MACKLHINSDCRLFGSNLFNQQDKRLTKFEAFKAGPIQVQEARFYEDMGWDIIHDGFRYEGISESLIETI